MAEQTAEQTRARADKDILSPGEWYDLIVKASADGSWFYDIDEERVHYSPSVLDFLEVDSDEGFLRPDHVMARVHPDDREGYRRDLARALKGESEMLHSEIRMQSDSGEYRWILNRGIARRDAAGRAYCMVGSIFDITRRRQLEDALRAVALSTSEGAGPDFFDSMVRYLAEALGSDAAMIGTLDEDDRDTVNTIALYKDGASIGNISYHLADTPCRNVIDRQVCAYPEGVHRRFPRDQFLVDQNIEAYVGSPLVNSADQPIGIVSALFRRPVSDLRTTENLLRIFAARASAELERQTKVEALRDSEARFKDIAEASSDWFWEMGPDLRFTYLSDRIEEVSGVTADQFIGRTRQEVMGDSAGPQAVEHIEALEKRQPFRDFVYHVDTTGGRRYFKISGRPVFDADSRFLGYRGAGTDITDINTAEEALRRYERLVSASSDCMAYVGRDCVYQLVNEPYAAIFGTDINDLVGRPVREFLDADVFDREIRPRLDRALSGTTSHWSVWLRHPQHGRRYFNVSCSPRIEADGSVPGAAVVARDVTELKQTEDELRRSRALLSDAQRMAVLGSFEWDYVEDRFACSAEIGGILGLDSGALPRTHDESLRLVHPGDRERVRHTRTAVTGSAGESYEIEYRIRRPDGEERIVQERGEIMCSQDERSPRLVSAVQDTTERVRREEALARSERRYRELYHRTPVMLHSIDREGRIVAVSAYWLQYLGYREEQVLGRKSTDFLTPESQRFAREEVLPAFFRTGVCRNVPYQLVKANGEVVDVLLSAVAERDEAGNIERSLAVMTDITEQRRAEADFRNIFDNVGEGIYRSTPEGELVRANPALARLQGFETPGELLQAVENLDSDWYLEPGKRAELNRALERHGFVDDFEAEVKRLNRDERIWTSETVRATRDGDGRVLFYEGSVRDITAEYKARQLVKRRGEALEMIARDAPLDDVLNEIVDIAGEQQEHLVAAILRLTHGRVSVSAVPDLARSCVEVLHGSTPGEVGGVIKAALENDSEVVADALGEDGSATSRFYDALKAAGYGAAYATPIRDRAGATLGVLAAFVTAGRSVDRESVGLLREIAQIASIAKEKHRLSEELRRQAHYDSLTDLPNRALLTDRLGHAMHEADRGGYSVGVLLLDLDEFKLVNDSLGHGAGDELLRAVAARLENCVRGADTVARLGGDEFVLVVPLAGGEDYCLDVADRLVQSLREPFQAAGREVSARPSVGVSLYPQDGRTTEALLMAADTAMYAAKHAGKDQFRFFTESMNRRVSERLRVESELRDALRSDELELHYQPRMCLARAGLRGAEALLRWRHPEQGLLTAGEFIDIAERSPLMSEIDQVVLDQASQRLAAWQRAGRRMVLSVNLSARELNAEGFAGQVARTLEAAGVDASGLELEITESMLMRDHERSRRQLAELKERAPGIRIAIDDFGSGYSSLNYLRQLPIDTLKIDRSFVADLEGADQATAAAIIRTIVEFGRSLALTVVAEGVETEGQVRRLREYGCNQAQGFLYAPALPVELFDSRY